MRIVVSCLLGLLTGCVATVDPDWARTAAERHGETQELPVADRLLHGFDRRTNGGEDQRVALGDRLLYRVVLREGDVVEQEWLVRLTLEHAIMRGPNGKPEIHTALHASAKGGGSRPLILPYRVLPVGGDGAIREFESTVSQAGVEIYDAAGRFQRRSNVRVARAFLERGLASACAAEAGRSQRRSAEHALVAFLAIVRKDPVLRDVFWEVVRLPSLWSIVVNLDVRLSIDAQFAGATPCKVTVGDDTVSAWDLPVRILGNGQPMLLVSFRVTAPRSPLGLGAGILSLVAVKPGNPERTAIIQLLAARRGPLRAGR